MTACWGSASVIGDKVYVADEDGDVSIFQHSPDPRIAMINGEPVAEILMENSIYSTLVVANDVLFFTTRNKLYAIAAPKKKTPAGK